jgi:hypothetical protein
MGNQAFFPRDFSPALTDLIPPAEPEPEEDSRWQEYCRHAARLDRPDILAVVLDELREAPELLEMIEDACANPHEPGRPKTATHELLAMGKACLRLIVQAVDNAVSVRMALEELHDVRP